MAALLALTVLIGLGARQSDAQTARLITLKLTAGESIPLEQLSKDATPEVEFIQNSNCFVLQCSAPGHCNVLGAQAGRGRIRATLPNGDPVIYQIVVSAVAKPDQQLHPGAAPPPAGDIFAGDSANPGARSAVSTVAGVKTADGVAPMPSSPAIGADTAKAADGAAVAYNNPPVKLSQNPAVNALELPPPTGPRAHYLPAKSIKLTVGASRIFDFPIALTRVAIADTTVADVSVVGPNQIMVVAHRPGATTLSIWQENHEYFERVVRVEQGGPQQVQLHVVVAELDRSRLEAQGLDISMALSNAGISVVGLQGDVATPYNVQTNLTASGGAGTVVALPPSGVFTPGGQLIPLLLSNNISYGFASTNGQWTTNAMFQLLEDHNLAKILAEPTLIAASGEQARFLSGGEIPIVIAQALNTSIVFKQFGTSVVFVPTVIDDDEIELRVSPEFSQPDYTQGVQLFGFTVPAFVTRRAQTLVRMRENQTLIIAGLVLDNVQSEVRKTPYLGDLPYLGALFRHTYYNRNKTELVMTVTPQIIRPIPAGIRVALPTDHGPLSPQEVRTRPLSQPDASRPRFQ